LSEQTASTELDGTIALCQGDPTNSVSLILKPETASGETTLEETVGLGFQVDDIDGFQELLQKNASTWLITSISDSTRADDRFFMAVDQHENLYHVHQGQPDG
jgi:hypothetical protein